MCTSKCPVYGLSLKMKQSKCVALKALAFQHAEPKSATSTILVPFIIWPADILSSLHLILMDVVPTTNNSQKSVFLFEYCSIYGLAFKATEVCDFCLFFFS